MKRVLVISTILIFCMGCNEQTVEISDIDLIKEVFSYKGDEIRIFIPMNGRINVPSHTITFDQNEYITSYEDRKAVLFCYAGYNYKRNTWKPEEVSIRFLICKWTNSLQSRNTIQELEEDLYEHYNALQNNPLYENISWVKKVGTIEKFPLRDWCHLVAYKTKNLENRKTSSNIINTDLYCTFVKTNESYMLIRADYFDGVTKQPEVLEYVRSVVNKMVGYVDIEDKGVTH